MEIIIDTDEFDKQINDSIRLLRELPKELDRSVLQFAFMAMARVVAKAARGLVAVLTGRLKRSIRVRASPSKYKPGALIIASGSKKDRVEGYHATLVEEGTIRTRAQPYMQPAARNTTEAQGQAAVAEINRRIVPLINRLRRRR